MRARAAPASSASSKACGEKSNSFHRTRSSPDGKPIVARMRNALADAGIAPEDIDYINAHGTSTPENDKMEHLGSPTVFGETIRGIPISSNKSMIGHTLTAAGVVEAAFTLADAASTSASRRPSITPFPTRRSRSTWCRMWRAMPSAARHLEFVRLRRAECLPRHGAGAGVTSVVGPKRCATAGRSRRCARLRWSPTARWNCARSPRRRRRAQAKCRSPSRRSASITSTSGAGAAWPSPSARCR